MDSEKKSLDPDLHDFDPNPIKYPGLPCEAPPYTPPLPGAQVITAPPPYSNSPNAISPVYSMAAPRVHFNDYLMISVVTLFFFPPLGIAALVLSCQTRRLLRHGDLISAEKKSRTSFWLNLVALVLGLVLHAIWIALLVQAAMRGKYVHNGGPASPWNSPIRPPVSGGDHDGHDGGGHSSEDHQD